MTLDRLIGNLLQALIVEDEKKVRELISSKKWKHLDLSECEKLIWRAGKVQNINITHLFINFLKSVCADDNIRLEFLIAIMEGNIKLVKEFLENGMTTENIRYNKIGSHLPAIYSAIFARSNLEGRKEMLTLLLEYGLQTKLKNFFGNLLDNIALFVREDDKSAADIAEILTDSGVPAEEAFRSRSNLHSACVLKNIELASCLIKKGANVNGID